MEPVYRYRAICVRVKDGDTYVLQIDVGFYMTVTLPVRLHGWNTPELDTIPGKDAKQAAERLLFAPHMGEIKPVPLVIESYKGQRTFERWVCDVWLPDGRSLGEALNQLGHASRIA